MCVFCDVPDYGCHGWLRETWVCPGHLTAMYIALTHLVLLAQSITVLGVGEGSFTKRLTAHCWRKDVYFVCLQKLHEATSSLVRKGRLTGFCSTKWQLEKGSLSRVPGEVEALQNGSVFFFKYFLKNMNAHIWPSLDENVKMVVDEKDPRQLTANTIL